MNLFAKLQEREAQGRPLRVGIIGAGKFGAMDMAQVPRKPGVHLAGIADLSPANARASLARVGWKPEQCAAASLDAALKERRTNVSDDGRALVAHPAMEIVVEATGNPIAAVEHALAALRNGKHVVMVTVEADAFCGPLLAKKAKEAGVVYSLAYGDQPAIICDLVDWARAAGFPVVAAGRGHKWLPHFAQSTPETVWGYYGLTPEQARVGGLNPKMFNSFLDGSKPAIEATAVCNATGLTPAPEGLAYPPASIEDLPLVMRPKAEGGQLHHKGQVEVVSSLRRDRARTRLRPASQGAGRSRVLARSRRAGDSLRHSLRRVGGVRGRVRLHPALLHGIRRANRPFGAICVDVQALAPDRARGRNIGGLGRVAWRAVRVRHGLSRRRSGERQARLEGRRDARRRRRIHGGGQADARRGFACARRVAARFGAPIEASQSRQGRPGRALGRCRLRRRGRGGAGAPRNGVDIRRPPTARGLRTRPGAGNATIWDISQFPAKYSVIGPRPETAACDKDI